MSTLIQNESLSRRSPPRSVIFFTIFCGVFFIAMWSAGTALGRDEVPPAESNIGKKAAARYFSERTKGGAGESEKGEESNRNPAGATKKARYLGLHLGVYTDENAYKWGGKDNKDMGQLTAGVTYRMGEWVNSMDLLLRVDFNSYKFREGNVLKMSLMPVITFPDANSEFPLYFGGGAGVGVFFKQIADESPLSFDYQLLMGVRVFRLFGDAGLTFETGLKNHVHLMSDGQYNGVFVALGTVFNF
ncbi:MAG: hypothetical protein IPJ71_11660 [Bdellovibrionales bacterium]|nr:hypothetical protein [Bdellovibrionales bacterium]